MTFYFSCEALSRVRKQMKSARLGIYQNSSQCLVIALKGPWGLGTSGLLFFPFTRSFIYLCSKHRWSGYCAGCRGCSIAPERQESALGGGWINK